MQQQKRAPQDGALFYEQKFLYADRKTLINSSASGPVARERVVGRTLGRDGRFGVL
ncbi:hypothetical protein [Thioalkalivibrio sp. ALJ24]|uniref:hypothetical protein n=1 Tax=Thioalkalivibrio sp. ALJ24 TaxID=545276 RepID=UPI0012EA4660|nr:hypothetical protein [Thioalkalivibrio sp. ALJ24]